MKTAEYNHHTYLSLINAFGEVSEVSALGYERAGS